MRKQIAPIDIHLRFLNVCGDQTVDVSTVKGSGWCIAAVATVTWEIGHILGGPARLSAHETKSTVISSSAQISANHQL
jgi:hypothetical protein